MVPTKIACPMTASTAPVLKWLRLLASSKGLGAYTGGSLPNASVALVPDIKRLSLVKTLAACCRSVWFGSSCFQIASLTPASSKRISLSQTV